MATASAFLSSDQPRLADGSTFVETNRTASDGSAAPDRTWQIVSSMPLVEGVKGDAPGGADGALYVIGYLYQLATVP